MQITVDIPDQVVAKAAALGVSVEEYVREVLGREVPVLPATAKLKSREEIRAWLEDMAQFSDQIPELPDESLTRESFYRDHD
jgi:hypothetical protein